MEHSYKFSRDIIVPIELQREAKKKYKHDIFYSLFLSVIVIYNKF